ncbi:hypothetical protein [Nocardia sp. NPDC058114]|uniref:hypothetical protein n=1 Tax=Nocardia sp. NPDC058114 TaxID=3346346 RepID=UPI0036DBC698
MAITDNAFNNDESRFSRLLTTLAHLMLCALAAVAAAHVTTYFDYQAPSSSSRS